MGKHDGTEWFEEYKRARLRCEEGTPIGLVLQPQSPYMDGDTKEVAKCLLSMQGPWDYLVDRANFRKEKGHRRPWVSTSDVREAFRQTLAPELQSFLTKKGMGWINFESITTVANKIILKENNEMGLMKVVDERGRQEMGVAVGTEHNGRMIVAVALREDGSRGGWSDRYYTFFVDRNVELVSGDLVVVDSANTPNVGKVLNIELSESELARCSKWVIGRIDMTAHNNRIEMEQKLKAMENKLEQRMKNVEKNMKYIMLAAQDPEMARMYNEMRAINPSMPALPEGTKVAELSE
jgi:hypothetical protein